jgi:2-methylisocitrate lyase-like PEP mutase family enzyme
MMKVTFRSNILLLLFPVSTALLLTPAERLLSLASSQKGTLLPGIYDALSAKVFERQGAAALFLSGFGVSAAKLGRPDAGILTYSEMEEVTRHVCSVTTVPVVVDGDTGYGGTATMRRAIRGLAAAGAAAITIEDQVFPKRCTYVAGDGVRVVDREASLRRLKTALASRHEANEVDGTHVLIVGRTDCRAALGFDEALARCLEFQDMGADIVYAENLQSKDEYVKLRAQITTPMILAQVQVGTTGGAPLFSLQDIAEMGYDFALFGVTSLQATAAALQGAADEMLAGGIVERQPLASFATVKEIVDVEDLEDFESLYYCE